MEKPDCIEPASVLLEVVPHLPVNKPALDVAVIQVIRRDDVVEAPLSKSNGDKVLWMKNRSDDQIEHFRGERPWEARIDVARGSVTRSNGVEMEGDVGWGGGGHGDDELREG